MYLYEQFLMLTLLRDCIQYAYMQILFNKKQMLFIPKAYVTTKTVNEPVRTNKIHKKQKVAIDE